MSRVLREAIIEAFMENAGLTRSQAIEAINYSLKRKLWKERVRVWLSYSV